jgi:heme/copper-type cytochrome/quinol oxidase subunit 2
LFGLVPGLGDIVGAVIGVYALHVARRLRAPGEVQLHMLTNIALDATVGTIPILGDLFDFAYKAQTRNLALIDDWLQTPQEARRRSRRGLILIPLVIFFVFVTLTIIGVVALFFFIRWIAGLF